VFKVEFKASIAPYLDLTDDRPTSEVDVGALDLRAKASRNGSVLLTAVRMGGRFTAAFRLGWSSSAIFNDNLMETSFQNAAENESRTSGGTKGSGRRGFVFFSANMCLRALRAGFDTYICGASPDTLSCVRWYANPRRRGVV
jgi:hypothetical protein